MPIIYHNILAEQTFEIKVDLQLREVTIFGQPQEAAKIS
jgi:hypothetical protein